ncbi:MAG: hypothetical protein J6S85_09270 [Methanobrevibacter sp.]|nr:hypothetical protein [Methanobrevibacter sp.]
MYNDYLKSTLENATREAENNTSTELIGGKDTQFYVFRDEVKDKDGNIKLVERHITEPALIESLVTISAISKLAEVSTSILAFEFSKITKEQAEKYKCKNPIEFIAKNFPRYDTNTIGKYRRVGLLFCDRTSKVFAFRKGVDSDVSVNTLDKVVALASKGKKLETLTEEELETLYNEFYNNYVANGRINLNAPQSKVLARVNEIKNEIDGIIKSEKEIETSNNSDNLSNSENSTSDNTNSENSVSDNTNSENSATTPENTENIRTSAEEHLNLLRVIFKDNKNALNLIAKLIKEAEKLN